MPYPLKSHMYQRPPSPGPQVAERSLFLWNNEAVVGLVAQHRGAVVPAVLPALEKNARSHWNPAVHGLTVNVRKMFQEMDAQLYEQCRQRFEHEEVRPAVCMTVIRSPLRQLQPEVQVTSSALTPLCACCTFNTSTSGSHRIISHTQMHHILQYCFQLD